MRHPIRQVHIIANLFSVVKRGRARRCPAEVVIVDIISLNPAEDFF